MIEHTIDAKANAATPRRRFDMDIACAVAHRALHQPVNQIDDWTAGRGFVDAGVILHLLFEQFEIVIHVEAGDVFGQILTVVLRFAECPQDVSRSSQYRRDYWLSRLEAEDVPFAPVNTLPEVFDDPQIKHLDPYFTTSHATEGEMTLLRRPIRFDGSRDDQPLNAPPTLGEHTAELLAEIGFDDEAVEKLRRDEII